MGISKLLKKGISKDNVGLVKAKRQLIEIAEKVMANGRRVKAQVDTLQEKPSCVSRLGEQLGGWLDGTEKIVRQTVAVVKEQFSIPGS